MFIVQIYTKPTYKLKYIKYQHSMYTWLMQNQYKLFIYIWKSSQRMNLRMLDRKQVLTILCKQAKIIKKNV